MAAPRWQEVVRWQSERLLAKRTHRGLGPKMEARRWLGTVLLEWRSRVSELTGALCEEVGALVPDPRVAVPRDLRPAMEKCQKPFQLWNVPRQVKDHPFELSHEPAIAERLGEGWLVRPEWPAREMAAASSELSDWRAAALERVRPPMEGGGE